MANVVFIGGPGATSEGILQELARFLSGEPEPPAPAEGEEPQAVEPSAFERECVELETKREFKQLSAKLMGALKGRFGSASESDIQTAYALLMELLIQWQHLADQALALADGLCESVEERPLLRRTLLLSVYNMALRYSLLEARFPLLLKTIKFCHGTGVLDQILGGPGKRCVKVQHFISEWELSADQQKELWGVVFDAFTDNARATYEHATKYLPLHGSADLQKQPELRSRLVQCVLVTLRSSEMLNCDKLVKIPVVELLSKDKEFSVLHRLLQIFASEMYGDYLKLYEGAAVKAFMQKHDLDHAACQRKMRLLSLVSLAQAKKELTYAAIATELQFDESEVETWVMEAISSGLVVAKMDQMRQVVIVTVCLEREFGDKQWDQLKDSLKDWHEQISSLLHVRGTVTAR